MNNSKCFALILACFLLLKINAQQTGINPELLENTWHASWITTITGKHMPDVPGVFLFRKTIKIDEIVKDFVLHVSADNRYEFFVNGFFVGRGPARSVPEHWNFETYDVAGYLKPGKNVLAAKVLNWDNPPWAQTSLRTGLIVQGNTQKEQIANTGYSWKVKKEGAWEFFEYSKEDFPRTTGVGPCEKIDGNKMTWNWPEPGFDDSDWLNAEEIMAGSPEKITSDGFNWALTSSPIPQMDTAIIKLDHVEKSEGVSVDSLFCTGKSEFTVPAKTKAVVLFDNETLTVVHPQLTVEGGKGSQIKLVYSEAMYDEDLNKANRDKVQGMQIKGYYDLFLPDGNQRTFQPLWNRTYRYLQMEITTDDNPVTIKNYQGTINVYPFRLKASFESSDPYLEKIFKTGWRTGRMCALENYVDCPYYEQLQYFGDLNVSNPITVLLSGDTRLMKSAILQGKYSITGEGLTLCAAPSKSGKIIPFFSIAWIGMVKNYWDYTGDKEFVTTLIPEMEGIMDWYQSKLNDQWMLGPMSYWNFVDCTEQWPWAPDKGSICEPIGSKKGNSSILTLQYVYGLQLVSKMFEELGHPEKAIKHKALADKIKNATYQLCWDVERQLIADVPDKSSFSQHANIFAALTGTIPEDKVKTLISDVYNRNDIIQASTQFQAYYHQLLVKYGLGEHYLNHLSTWKQLIDWGFTTFPEYPQLNTRSDCHAWNAYPAYELLTIVCGIQNTAPGFKTAVIEPHLGDLEWVEGTLPWKNSYIAVKLKQKKQKISGEVHIPKGLNASFKWKGNEKQLIAGENKINLKNKTGINR